VTREKQSGDQEIWRSDDRMNKEAIAPGRFSIHPITGLLLPFTRSSDHSISRSPDDPITRSPDPIDTHRKEIVCLRGESGFLSLRGEGGNGD
jgi:hypothetical protein